MNLRQKLVVTISALTAVLFLGLTLWLLLFQGELSSFRPKLPTLSFQENPVAWTEQFLAGNLPGSRTLTALHTRTDVFLGQQKVGEIYINGDTLIEELPKPESGVLARLSDDLNTFAVNCASHIFFMAVPTRYEFLQNELNNVTPAWSQRIFSKDLAGRLTGYITELDIYSELVDARDTDIWFNTETLWTSRGAHLGYEVFASQAGLNPQALDSLNLEIVSYDFEGSLRRELYGAAGAVDRVDLYYDPHASDAAHVERFTADGLQTEDSVYAREWLDTPLQDNFFLGEDCALTRVTSTVTNERKLLIIGDGFADVLLPFFLRGYSSIDLIKLPLLDEKTAAEIDTADYDAVLIVYGVNTLVTGDTFEPLSLLY